MSTPLLALLQEAEPAAGGDGPLLLGYCLVACGAADLVVALLMLLTEKPADAKRRTVVVGAIAFSGLAMIVVGILLWMGIVGRG